MEKGKYFVCGTGNDDIAPDDDYASMFFESPDFRIKVMPSKPSRLNKYFMPQIQKFSAEQIKEAQDWLKANIPTLYILIEKALHDEIAYDLYDMYFKVKQVEMKLQPNQFVVGVEYKDENKVKTGDEPVSLSFWNPHAQGQYNKFAKDVLLHILSDKK